MRKQPNFHELFHKYFGMPPRKVTYQVRGDSNRYHDMIFLVSLIHDARFKREQMVLRGARLSIPIERDCWELPMAEHPGSAELYVARARLTISPVKKIVWQFEHVLGFASKDELWIQDIWLDRQATQPDDSMPVTINGFMWQCILTVHEPDLKIRLQDLETPYLYSETKRRKRLKS